MSLSDSDRESLSQLGTLTKEELNILNLTFQDLYYRAKLCNIALATDDRAAALEASIIRFLLASRPA